MEKVVYKVGSFTDYAGRQREVIFAAVSVSNEAAWILEKGKDFVVCEFLPKQLRLGVAVQNVGDIANTELGKKIAYGKAMKEKSCFSKMYVTDKGLINKTVVEAVLEQEFKYFCENPGKYLKGYNHAKEVFNKSLVRENDLLSKI